MNSRNSAPKRHRRSENNEYERTRTPPKRKRSNNIETKSEVCQESSSKCEATVEQCPICLETIEPQKLCVLDCCSHHKFCLTCLGEWAKMHNTCPVDRKIFHSILVLDPHGKVTETIPNNLNRVIGVVDIDIDTDDSEWEYDDIDYDEDEELFFDDDDDEEEDAYDDVEYDDIDLSDFDA